MEKVIKIGLAILLFLCLLKMPYGYFQLVRFLAMAGFAYLGWLAYEAGQKNSAFIFFALTLLFQPIIKISLGRELWNIVDVIVGIGLIYYTFRDTKGT